MTLEELREKVLRVQSDPDRWGYTYAFSHRQALALLECAQALGIVVSDNAEAFRDVWTGTGHDTRHECLFCGSSQGHDDDCAIHKSAQALAKLKEAGVTI